MNTYIAGFSIAKCTNSFFHIHFPLQVENILIADSGHYVLCDFGSSTAKVLDPGQQNISQIEEEIQK